MTGRKGHSGEFHFLSLMEQWTESGRGSWLCIPDPHPTSHTFFISILSPNFGETRFPGSSQTPDPVNILIVFPTPALHFGQILNPRNTLLDPDWRSRGNRITTITGTRPRNAKSIPLPKVKSFITQAFSTLCNLFPNTINIFIVIPIHEPHFGQIPGIPFRPWLDVEGKQNHHNHLY